MLELYREADLEEIREKIRQCICLELLVALLEKDKPMTKPMHTGWIFAQFMDGVIQMIRDDLTAMREDLRSAVKSMNSVILTSLFEWNATNCFGCFWD
jgi:hypothetical protein